MQIKNAYNSFGQLQEAILFYPINSTIDTTSILVQKPGGVSSRVILQQSLRKRTVRSKTRTASSGFELSILLRSLWLHEVST